MTDQELIELAKQKYPLNTRFKSAYSGVEYTAGSEFHMDRDNLRSKSNNSPIVYVKSLEKWAEVVEYPKDYAPILETNNYQIY